MPLPGRPVAFVPVADLERARSFYAERLGLRVVSSDFAGVDMEGAGALVRLAQVPGHTPLPHTVFGFQVESVAGALTAAGVEALLFGLPGQRADGVWTPPGGAVSVAWFHDSEGNVVSFSGG